MADYEERLTNAGERMIVGNLWGYWAHLSIYRFAVPLAQGKRVLDAGSGSGYGSSYLARHGASVLALDAGIFAIEHSRQRYAGDTVTFEVADLNSRLSLGDNVFDLVFSSNVFEHVANVDGLAAECARVMKGDGAAIIAVPPICSAAALAADMDNHFHVHHIPPTAWAAKLGRFFADVQCYGHFGLGEFASPARQEHEMRLPPDDVTIRETDFEFPEMSPADMLRQGTSITALFVCRGPRPKPEPQTIQERTPFDWREGEVAANKIAKARQQVDEVRTSMASEMLALQAQNRETEERFRSAEASASRRAISWIKGLWRNTRRFRRAVRAALAPIGR
jgi:SAM-dependent methyltransferase